MPKLETSIQFFSGVGPKMAEKLKRLGIETVRDLIFYWPRAWQDFSNPQTISSLRIDDEAIIKVKIISVEQIRSPRKWMSIINAEMQDDSGKIKAVWFNQSFLKNILKIGDEWLIAGKVGWDFKNKCKVFTPSQLEKEPIILPIYAETAGLTSKFLRKIIRPILNNFCHSGQGGTPDPESSGLIDYLPDETRQSMLSLTSAIQKIHFPDSNTDLAKAKSRLAFDELFLIALRFLTIKKELQQNVAPKMEIDETILRDFTSKLPYKLTNAQRKSAWEIIKDLARTIPMNRLLEGDVGSGKTVVAAMAALVSSNNKYQSVWLAPTEILANQHFENVTKLLSPFDISVGLLTGANKKADLARDNLIIGTHAVLQKDVNFPNLGLIIIDEQHRFGVKQRAFLRSKTSTCTSEVQVRSIDMIPHLLSMTATPIPRTLALALYGDLDISIIDEMPAGRQKVETRVVASADRQKAYDFIANEIAKGRQAFVICPLIEASEKTQVNLFDADRKSAVAEYDKLSKNIFPDLKIGLMHGKLKSAEKAEVMEKFKKGQIDILVSTAVVEVGIDIQNATVMMIESAERFGLAQLHQFRGRVGRGADQSYCFLFSDSDSDLTRERLNAMSRSNNGFELAQKDLELRGQGEIVGIRQSGLDSLKMASLSDTIMLKDAREAAEKIVDDGIAKYPALVAKLKEFEVERHLE